MIGSRLEHWLLDQHILEDPVEHAMRTRGEEAGFPIVGPLVGRFLEVQARSLGARQVFEMGSGFGYSTWWHARAVGEAGRVIHCDGDPNLSAEARRWLTQAGLEERVEFHVGNALDVLRDQDGPFDIVFIDVDKEQYPDAWAIACEKVRLGGAVVTDNTLWSGKVADPAERSDATRGVRDYVRAAMGDDRFLTTINPLRDGVAVSLRIA